VQKINRDRPTIHALQKAGRLIEKRKTLATPQDNKDHDAFAAELEEQLRAEAAAAEGSAQQGGALSDSDVNWDDFDDNGFESEPALPPTPARKTPKAKAKGKKKGKGKEKVQETVRNSGKTGRKRKVRFEDDEASEPEGIVRRSGRVSKKTKKARGAKTVL
jgi:hypothetical protein